MDLPVERPPSRWQRIIESAPMYVVAGTLAVVAVVSFATRNRLSREAVRPPAASGRARFRIVFSTPAGELAEKAYDQLIRAFERKHPDIDVKFNVAPGGRRFDSVIGTYIAGRSAPDVFFFEDEPFAEFVRAKAFLPLDAYIGRDDYAVEDFFAKAQQEFVIDGVTYGFSQGWGAIILLYNKDIFVERGVTYSDDWTWDDFLQACRTLTFDRDGDGDVDVYAYQGQRNFSHACIPIWSAGAEVLSADRSRWTLTTPDVVRAFEWWASIYTADPPVTPQGAETHDPVFATMSDPFMEGRVAMRQAGAYACWAMRGHTGFRWGIGYMPKCPRGPGGKPNRVTRLYGDSYVIWDRYPPNWMVNHGLLTRPVIARMRPEAQENLVGVPDAAALSDEQLAAALIARKMRIDPPLLTAELLRIWESGEPARAAMNEKLRAEMTRRDAAWELLKYLSGVPGQRLIARMGRSTPGRRSVANSRYFNRPDTPYDESRMVRAIEFAHLQPITPNFGDVQRIWAKYVDRIFLRGDGIYRKLTPREALVQMEAELNRLLAASREAHE